MAALIPDFDMIIGLFIDLEHGVFTHTIIGGLLFTFIFCSVMWLLGNDLLVENKISFSSLFFLVSLGMFSHLFLDSFTYFYSVETDATHHMYFWPIWNFPVHINTMFPSATWEIRVLIEVLVSAFLIVSIIGYGWIIKKQNPFKMFFSKNWLENLEIEEEAFNKKVQRQAHLVLGVNLAIIGFLILNYFL